MACQTGFKEATLNFHVWQSQIPLDYPDREFLLYGIKNGFDIVDSEKINTPVDIANYTSATGEDMVARVEDQIKTEIDNGRYVLVNEKPLIVSALGALPKKDAKRVRLIHDASRPAGQGALNDYCSAEKFSYQSIQDAVDIIKPGSFLAKVDLANAYRSVKINPSNYKATGLKWRFSGDQRVSYLVDTRLPFGSKRSPVIFNRLSQAVKAMMAARGYDIVAYLDDFLIVSDTREKCLTGLNTLLTLLRALLKSTILNSKARANAWSFSE